MSKDQFDGTLAAIELNAARKLNWDFNQFKDCLIFTVNQEAIEIETQKSPLNQAELQTLKQALLDYGFQYKKTVNDFILIFEQGVESR
jgi:hypothetical protein